jgi:hypothetical protein
MKRSDEIQEYLSFYAGAIILAEKKVFGIFPKTLY